jgi:hypothetical protein
MKNCKSTLPGAPYCLFPCHRTFWGSTCGLSLPTQKAWAPLALCLPKPAVLWWFVWRACQNPWFTRRLEKDPSQCCPGIWSPQQPLEPVGERGQGIRGFLEETGVARDTEVTSQIWEPDGLWLYSWLCHSLALWPWAGCFSSVGLSLLLWTMQNILPFLSLKLAFRPNDNNWTGSCR